MKKVFVTGGTGLLGTNLILRLHREGYAVRALARDPSRFLFPGLENVEWIRGDLSDAGQLTRAMDGCEYAVHIAALARHDLLRLDDYIPVNVEGTRHILQAARQAGTSKLVYVGTANTYGYGDEQNPGHEALPMRKPFTRSLYAMSKKMAQDLVDEASVRINITTVSPTFMIGPNDPKPSSGRMILAVLNKPVVFYPPGGKNFVYVGDVVRAIIRAFEHDTSGEKFILANENMTYKNFFRLVAHEAGQKTLLLPLPTPVLLGIGTAGDLVRGLGFPTQVSGFNTRILTVKNYYDNTLARTRLGISFTPIRQAVREAVAFFKANKTK